MTLRTTELTAELRMSSVNDLLSSSVKLVSERKDNAMEIVEEDEAVNAKDDEVLLTPNLAKKSRAFVSFDATTKMNKTVHT